MISNLNHTPPRTFSTLPKSWPARPRLINYDKADPAIHYEDGWRAVVYPDYDAALQRLGDLIFDEANDRFTYAVIDKSAEELEAERRTAIPFSIAPAQGRIALARRGLLAAIQSAIPTDVEDPTRIYWEYAISWERSHPLINQLAAALGLTEAQVDEIFIEAASNGL
jgi:hypothetical protein